MYLYWTGRPMLLAIASHISISISIRIILIYEYIILKNLNLSYSAVLRFSKFYFTVTAYSNSINSYSSRNLVSAITVRLIY